MLGTGSPALSRRIAFSAAAVLAGSARGRGSDAMLSTSIGVGAVVGGGEVGADAAVGAVADAVAGAVADAVVVEDGCYVLLKAPDPRK